MKEHGISLLQFVLVGDRRTLSRYMNELEPSQHNRFVSEFMLLEEYIANLEQTSYTDYSALEARGITRQSLMKAKRKYEDGRRVPEEGLLTVDEYNEAKELVSVRTETRHKKIDYSKLSREQSQFISMLSETLFSNYKYAKLYEFKNFVDLNEEGFFHIFNARYTSVRAVMIRYSKVSKYEIDVIKQNHTKLNKVMTYLKELPGKRLEPLIRDIKDIIDNTSNLSNLLKIIEAPSNFSISQREASEALKILRDDCNLYGIDFHPNHFRSSTSFLDTTENMKLDKSDLKVLEILNRDIESVLHYQ